MPMRIHELHPTLIHAPLAFLPAAAICDVAAVARGDPLLGRAGSWLWVGASAGALAAGTAGLAASQEVRVDGQQARDMMFLHGLGNLVLSGVGVGLTLWRLKNDPTPVSAAIGVIGTLTAVYTGWLGGQMVYTHGVGITGEGGPIPLDQSPPLFSRQAPRRLFLDAARGVRWLFSTLGEVVRRQRRLPREAIIGAEPVRLPTPPSEEVRPSAR